MVATSRLFAILNIAVCMPVHWLASNTHKWGARSIGRVFDIFQIALNNILDDITLIHEKSTMIFIFQKIVEEIPEFKALLVHEFHNKKTEFVVKSQTNAFPLNKVVEELFSLQDRNNKYSTTILNRLGKTDIKTMIKELEDKPRLFTSIYQYMGLSIPGSITRTSRINPCLEKW